MEKEIIELEEKLRLALLNSDVVVLDELINDSLYFISPDGSVVTKQIDLNIHKSNMQKMTDLIPSEQTIKVDENVAVVTVKMDIKGTYGKFDISGQYRYLRVWTKSNDKWQVKAGSVTKIQ